MATRAALEFTSQDLKTLKDRFKHPDPRVQRRLEVLWLISQGETHARAAHLAGVSRATGERSVALFRTEGMEGVRRFQWSRPVSALASHRGPLEVSFEQQPPRTVAEACARIQEATGLERRPTQVRAFLNKTLGLKWRCLGAIPVPPKKTPEEHARTQKAYLQQTLEPALAQAREGQAHLFFVDAAHFVRGAYLGHVWCRVRRVIRGASGRQRYSVLGAWNAVTHTLVSITTDGTVNAVTMCALLRAIAALGLTGPIRLVLDNARYQRCPLVTGLAKELHIDLLFLPSYSPNLNLIERLWKFVKKQVLYGRHYNTFADFRRAIDECLSQIPTKHRAALETLMTHKFQTFEDVSFLDA